MTSTIARIAPVFTHTPACDVNALGYVTRNARDTAATLPPEQVDALSLLEFLVDEARRVQSGAPYDESFTCGCARLALTRVEGELTRARKRYRALRNSPAFGSPEYGDVCRHIDALIVQRDAIRAAL